MFAGEMNEGVKVILFLLRNQLPQSWVRDFILEAAPSFGERARVDGLQLGL